MSRVRPTQPCRICGSQEASGWLHAREMMYGIRDPFTYFYCAACGCLQLDTLPADLDKYYPSDYYSFKEPANISVSWNTEIKLHIARPFMTRYKLGWGNRWERIWGRLLCAFKEGPAVPGWLHFLPGPIAWDSAILDVGCGSGITLLKLYNCGFTNLRGVDPFINESMTYHGKVQVEKCSLSAVQGKFQLITFNHVCEHLEDPVATLQQARQLLADGGQILIRIPLSDSMAAQKYRENWVQLDAPRHVTLQTRDSMAILAQKAGLKIIKVVYDSTEFQFTGSEHYLQNIPLRDEGLHSLFTPKAIKQYALEAERLNAIEQGDQAAFLLAV